MTEFKNMMKCFTCESQFQHGPHRYDGQFIPRYNIMVCNTCWNGNWDGWTPHHGTKIIEHLKKEGIPVPSMNPKGFLPRGD